MSFVVLNQNMLFARLAFPFKDIKLAHTNGNGKNSYILATGDDREVILGYNIIIIIIYVCIYIFI